MTNIYSSTVMYKNSFVQFPPDVVMIVNGRHITKSDILAQKKTRQARRLAFIRSRTEPIIKPCFIWTFCNEYSHSWIYAGWWLYIRTHQGDFRMGVKGVSDREMTLKVMHLYPCGLLPILENYDVWKQTFAERYPKPTEKRPHHNGIALAKAVLTPNSSRLLDILPCTH